MDVTDMHRSVPCLTVSVSDRQRTPASPTQGVCLKSRLLQRLLRLAAEHPAAALCALSGLSGFQASKIFLYGGVPLLLEALAAAPGPCLAILDKVAAQSPSSLMTELANRPAAVASLSSCLGDSDRVDGDAQACAAMLLANLAGAVQTGASAAAPPCVQPLVDEALPRACELLRDEGLAPQQLATGCALLAARLVPGSKTACRLVTQHTRALEPAVAALVQARKYAEAQAMLKAAGEFAREP